MVSEEPLTKWLFRALMGWEQLPRTDGEFSYIAVMRWGTMSSRTEDLRAACQKLALDLLTELLQQNLCSYVYLDNVLRLAVLLRVEGLGPLLIEVARRKSLIEPTRRLVLVAIIDLGIPCPLDFWSEILDFMLEKGVVRQSLTVAFLGLLSFSLDKALDSLPKLPDDPLLADSIVGALDAHRILQKDLGGDEFLAKLQPITSTCNPSLRASLNEFVESCVGAK